MNLKQLKELLTMCKKHSVSEIVFGKVHVSFVGTIKPEEPDHNVIVGLAQDIYEEQDEDGL